jgi:hypothetical protein
VGPRATLEVENIKYVAPDRNRNYDSPRSWEIWSALFLVIVISASYEPSGSFEPTVTTG